MPGKQLKGVEIFATGKWNGSEFKDNDLDQIIDSYKRLPIKVPIKLGHNEEQGLLASDGLPAGGWMTNVYKNGGKLVADFEGVPDKLHTILENGLYRKPSVELYRNYKDDQTGTSHPYAMAACSFLGGDVPAVTSLDDIMALFGLEHDAVETVESFGASTSFDTIETFTMEVPDMANELEKKIEQLEAENKELKEKVAKFETDEATETLKAEFSKKIEDKDGEISGLNEKVDTLTKEKEQVESELGTFRKEAEEKEIEGVLEDLVRDKHITPAQRDATKRRLAATSKTEKVKFTKKDEEGKEVEDERSERDDFITYLKSFAKADITTEPKTKVGEEADDENAQIAKLASEKNITFKKAKVEFHKQQLTKK